LANNSLDRLLIQANDGATILELVHKFSQDDLKSIFSTNKEGLLSLTDDFYAAEKGFTITFTAGSHQGNCLVIDTAGVDCLWLIMMQLVKSRPILKDTQKPEFRP
jgi:hypothetical protein